MKQIFGYLVIAWLALNQVLKFNIDILSIASLLGILCFFIIKEKFLDKGYISIIFLLLALALAQYNTEFILLSSITVLDFLYSKDYPLGALVFTITFLIFLQSGDYIYGLIMVFAALFGYLLGEKYDNEKHHTLVLDEERRLRYRLEEIQHELINSRKEIEHLTEIRERNRIAHEIHDGIGHGIAGVIFQIEAARRIIHKDIEKTESILKLCTQKLSEALELTRNTVYNIKADKKIGLEALKKLIYEFNFCSINFEHSGDFSRVSALNMNILEANIKESLTNALKHSKATTINIKIDIGKKTIRLYYKDDGIGCTNIHENLGICGMRERVKNAGGTIAIDGNEGFLIVSHLPVIREEYGEEERF